MRELAFVFSLGVLTGIGLSLIAAALYVRSWWRSVPPPDEDASTTLDTPDISPSTRKAA